MSSSRQSHFVHDGAERMAKAVRAEVYPEIEAAVTAEYSARLSTAGFVERIRLRREMRREIERRVNREVAGRLPGEDVLW